MVADSLSERTAISAVKVTAADAAICTSLLGNCTLLWGADGVCNALLGSIKLRIDLLFGCAVNSQVILNLSNNEQGVTIC